MKIGSVTAELFHTDRNDKANSRFSQFGESAHKRMKTLRSGRGDRVIQYKHYV